MDHQIRSPPPPPHQHPPYPPQAAAMQHHHPAAPPMMQTYLANYPLRNIAQPHYHDVLCGRGGGTNSHVGNSHWRMLVAANKELYVTLPKKQKMLLSKSIVNAVRSQTPPGRFLQKDPKTNLWYDVGDQRAQEKTSQALREGAPDIRSKIKDQGPEDGVAADTVAVEGAAASPERSSGTTKDKKPPAKLSPKGPPLPPPPPPQHSMMPPMPPQMGSPLMPPPHPHPMMYSAPPPHPSMQAGVPPCGYGNNMMLSPQGVPIGAASPYQPPHHMGPPPIPPSIPPQGPVRERRPSKHSRPQQQQQQQQQQQHQLKAPPPQSDNYSTRRDDVTGTKAIKMTHKWSPEQPSRKKAPLTCDNDNRVYIDESISRSYLPSQHRNHPSLEPIPVVSSSGGGGPGTGDVGVPRPPTGLNDEDQACSFGSIIMTDLEQARLMNGGSFGTSSAGVSPSTNTIYSSMKPPPPAAAATAASAAAARPPAMQVHFREEDLSHKPARRPSPTSYAPFPVDGGLESSAGLSFGSLMSIGSSNSGGNNMPTKLETGGLSIGSAMSYSVRGDVPPAVDGGLEGIGTSFGSLSLDREKVLPTGEMLEEVGASFGSMTISTQDRDDLLRAVGANTNSEQESSAVASMEKVATQTFLAQQKSKGSLLECSDTESEDEEESAQNSAQKSAEWEKLQATLAAQSKIPMASNVPPTLSSKRQSRRQPEPVPTDIPAAPFNRDYSQMSAISVGDGDFAQYQEQVMPEVGGSSYEADDQDAMPPPPPPPMQQRRQPEVDDDDLDDFNALRMLSSRQKRDLMD